MSYELGENEAVVGSNRWKEKDGGDWVYDKGGEAGFGRDEDNYAYVCMTENQSTDDGVKNLKCSQNGLTWSEVIKASEDMD